MLFIHFIYHLWLFREFSDPLFYALEFAGSKYTSILIHVKHLLYILYKAYFFKRSIMFSLHKIIIILLCIYFFCMPSCTIVAQMHKVVTSQPDVWWYLNHFSYNIFDAFVKKNGIMFVMEYVKLNMNEKV